jgi:hypothetical protein
VAKTVTRKVTHLVRWVVILALYLPHSLTLTLSSVSLLWSLDLDPALKLTLRNAKTPKTKVSKW